MQIARQAINTLREGSAMLMFLSDEYIELPAADIFDLSRLSE